MNITDALLTPNKYSRPQIPLKSVKKVVLHYVGNAGSTAMATRNYFENQKNGGRYVSSHYIVGLDGEILRCVPENEVAYCSNQAKAGMNPKTLQYLMGHSDIAVTLNVYTHVGLEDAENELRKMQTLEGARKEMGLSDKDDKPLKQNMFKVV